VLRYVRGKAAVKGSQVFVLPQVSPPCPQAEASSRRLCLQAAQPPRSAHRSEVVLFKCVSSSLRGWRLFRILLIVGVPTLKLCSEIRNPAQDTRLGKGGHGMFTPIRQVQAEASSRPRVCPSSASGLGPNAKRMVRQALGGIFSPGRKTKRKSRISQTVNGGSR
jgi:hypothetical protein